MSAVGSSPGRLVLVVGPSGSGKDTLIRAARTRLASDAAFVFPRRIITRPASLSEDNEPCTPADFSAREAQGAFAITWQAHGLDYAIPVSIGADLRQGRTVICNVSRAVVPDLRQRFDEVAVVEITASAAILAERLAGRGRAEDGDLGQRLARSAGIIGPNADAKVVNDGAIEDALGVFVDFIVGAGTPANRRPRPYAPARVSEDR